MPTAREFFERNVKDADLLGEFFTNYRLPHTDRDGKPLAVGDDVLWETTPKWHGSWINGKCGIILKLGVVSEAGEVEGHLCQTDRGLTVAPIECCIKVETHPDA